MKGFLPDPIHPLVDYRMKSIPKDIYDSYKDNTKGAGSHAECNALNSSLIDEFKIENNIKGEVTQEMLDEQYDMLKNMDISHIYISVQNLETYKKLLPEIGMSMPRCIHCQYISDGATINPKMREVEVKSSHRLGEFSNGN